MQLDFYFETCRQKLHHSPAQPFLRLRAGRHESLPARGVGSLRNRSEPVEYDDAPEKPEPGLSPGGPGLGPVRDVQLQEFPAEGHHAAGVRLRLRAGALRGAELGRERQVPGAQPAAPPAAAGRRDVLQPQLQRGEPGQRHGVRRQQPARHAPRPAEGCVRQAVQSGLPGVQAVVSTAGPAGSL